MRTAAKRTFGSLFEFIRNGMNIRQDKSGIGLPITRIETISDGFVDLSRVGYAGLRNGAADKWILEPGDILFSHINSVEHIGKCALYEGSDEPLVHGMNLLCLRPKLSELWPNYAKWLIKSAGFRTLIMPFVNKAVNQASISTKNLKGIEVTLPPLDEQKRIAAILDQADELRRLRQRAIDRLNELGQSIFYDMFGDPATNPMGWRMGTIGDLTESTQYGTSSKAGDEGTIPILRMGNITTAGHFDFQDMKFINLLDNEIDKYTVKDGDILFNRTNSPELVGKTGVYRGEKTYAYAGYLIRLRTNKEAVPEYIGTYLNSKVGKKILRGMCKAIIGMANINAKELRTIPIPLAPIDLQKKFQRKFVAYRSAIPAFQKHREYLETLFSSLQYRAFHGEM